ncbi:MAG: hypothetical protein ACRECV_13155 [Xanthobacteraceae bacterium]
MASGATDADATIYADFAAPGEWPGDKYYDRMNGRVEWGRRRRGRRRAQQCLRAMRRARADYQD